MSIQELTAMVGRIDPHTCSARDLRDAQAAVASFAHHDAHKLSDRALAGALTRRLLECARARVYDPIPFDALMERLR